MGQDLKTKIFYSLIGITASLGLFLLYYWSLRLDSSLGSLVQNFYNVPLYFWPYVTLTIGTIALFGVNIAFFVYRFRKYGAAQFRKQTGTGFGALIGLGAAACPVCGSTILAAIGLTSGLAAFPLGGLELKSLSFVLMLSSLWLIRRESCLPARNHLIKKSEQNYFNLLIAAVVILAFVNWNFLKADPVLAKFIPAGVADSHNFKLDSSFESKIVLGDSILKLVKNGVIDPQKFEALFKPRGGLPEDLKLIMTEPMNFPIQLTQKNSSYYINLLWPLGLANYMEANQQSPIQGASLFNFASTGGWTLGKKNNGGEYFNKFGIVPLTPQQEELVLKLAKNSYRPCCNNSAFFQDCNHGSALLGLLELGASQGLTEKDLWREALAFNSFWFADVYLQTAIYFKEIKGINWNEIDPEIIMGKDYSSASGWMQNVNKELSKRNLLPQKKGGSGCGV